MDLPALRLGNLMVGNETGAAALEATFMGPELSVSGEGLAVCAGAELGFSVNGREIGSWLNVALKDPVVMEFLGLPESPRLVESTLEQALVSNLQTFLLELGKGFAFLGRQYPLVVNGRDYFLDLLFYHARLKCYVVIELKAGEFKPEYVGKLNFYLSAVD